MGFQFVVFITFWISIWLFLFFATFFVHQPWKRVIEPILLKHLWYVTLKAAIKGSVLYQRVVRWFLTYRSAYLDDKELVERLRLYKIEKEKEHRWMRKHGFAKRL
jgi:hypothetical protein